jgi:hypothetical protein
VACINYTLDLAIPGAVDAIQAFVDKATRSEGTFLDMARTGQVTPPVGGTPEPFVDVDDIAEPAGSTRISRE